MTPGEVLIVDHGLDEPVAKKEDNLVLQYRGISEIQKWYSAVILQWCGYACVSQKGTQKQDFIVSRDLSYVIEVLQRKLSKFKPEGHGELPIIVSTTQPMTHISKTHDIGSIFLARRVMSGNGDSNQRRVALVRHRITANKSVMRRIKHYKNQHSQLEIKLYDRASFLESLAEDTNDIIFLPERSQWTYVIDESSLKEPLLDEDEEWTFFDAKFPFCKKKGVKTSKKGKILFSEEGELKELGLKTVLEICEAQKTLRCGRIWTDGYDGLSIDTLKRMVWCCHLDIDIPDFLDKCPKV